MPALRDIPYCKRPGQTLALDLYLPEKPAKAVVLFAHGGGFTRGKRLTRKTKWMSIRLTDAGYAMASVSYRLGVTGVDFPAEIRRSIRQNRAATTKTGISLKPRLYGAAFEAARQDIGEAIAYLRNNLSSWEIKCEKVGLIGVSAGGIAGLSLAYPPKNLPTPDAPDAVFAIASAMVQPWCLNANGPPCILLSALGYKIIGPENAELVSRKAQEVGAPLEVLMCERKGHAGPVEALSTDSDKTGVPYWSRMTEFFDRALSPTHSDV